MHVEVAEPEVTRKVSKVKIIKNGFAEIEYEETKIILVEGKPVEKVSKYKFEGQNLPHPDLMEALNHLRGHLALLCSQLDGKKPELNKLEDDEAFINLFKVTGLSLGGTGDSEGVTIIGTKKIKRGVLNLVTPFTRFMDENDPYEYESELNALSIHVFDEANYHLDDKIHPDVQLKIEYDAQSEGEKQDIE